MTEGLNVNMNGCLSPTMDYWPVSPTQAFYPVTAITGSSPTRDYELDKELKKWMDEGKRITIKPLISQVGFNRLWKHTIKIALQEKIFNVCKSVCS